MKKTAFQIAYEKFEKKKNKTKTIDEIFEERQENKLLEPADKLVKSMLFNENAFKKDEIIPTEPKYFSEEENKRIIEGRKLTQNNMDKKQEQKSKNTIEYQKKTMESELRGINASANVFEKKATLEQKKERQKKVAELERGIKEAELKLSESIAEERGLAKKQKQISVGQVEKSAEKFEYLGDEYTEWGEKTKKAGEELENKVEVSAQKAEETTRRIETETKELTEEKSQAQPETKSQHPESAMQRKTREEEGAERARLEAEKEKLNPRDVQIWAWRVANKKFDTSKAEIPTDFKATPEIEEVAKNYLANRNLFVEAEKDFKKSGVKGGPEEMWFRNRENFTNRALDVIKRQMFNDIVGEKAGALKAQGLSDKKIKELLETTELPYFHKAIFNFATAAETELMEHRTRELCEPREQGMISRVMEKYRTMPRWKRLIVGGVVAGGIGAGIGIWGGAGLVAAGAIGGTRAARALFGGTVAAGVNAIADTWIGGKYGKQRRETISVAEKESLIKMQAEIAAMKKEGKNWMEEEERKIDLMRGIDDDAKNLNGKIQNILARERRVRGYAALGSGIVGGLSAWAAYTNWDTLIGGIKPAGIGSEHLSIGSRGPEGAIIDYFKGHSDVAKQFGWDGVSDINKWAGSEAHKLWLDQAKAALMDPETASKIKAAGFPLTEEGYAKAMHKIGKGFVDINLETKGVNLTDVEYLKHTAGKVFVPGERVEDITSAPFFSERYAVDIPSVGEVEAGISGPAHSFKEAINQYITLGDSDKLQVFLDSPRGKIAGIVNSLERLNVASKNFETAVNKIGGIEKFLDAKFTDIANPHFDENTNIVYKIFSQKIQRLFGGEISGEAPIRDILKNISSKNVFEGNAQDLIQKGIIK